MPATCPSFYSSECNPNPKLTDVLAGILPLKQLCYIILDGTSDVDAGGPQSKFRELQQIVRRLAAKAKVIAATFPRQHDLPQGREIHHETALVNNFIKELCWRLKVEVIDLDSIHRHWFSRCGMHLRLPGKWLLTYLMLRGLIKKVLHDTTTGARGAERAACIDHPRLPTRAGTWTPSRAEYQNNPLPWLTP